jgi:hypothetical protein
MRPISDLEINFVDSWKQTSLLTTLEGALRHQPPLATTTKFSLEDAVQSVAGWRSPERFPRCAEAHAGGHRPSARPGQA